MPRPPNPLSCWISPSRAPEVSTAPVCSGQSSWPKRRPVGQHTPLVLEPHTSIRSAGRPAPAEPCPPSRSLCPRSSSAPTPASRRHGVATCGCPRGGSAHRAPQAGRRPRPCSAAGKLAGATPPALVLARRQPACSDPAPPSKHMLTCLSPLQLRGSYLPSCSRRPRRALHCRVAAAAGQPWRFDDLTAASSGVTSFDELWGEQMRAMERAQSMFDTQRRQVTALGLRQRCSAATHALSPPAFAFRPGPRPLNLRFLCTLPAYCSP